MKKHALFPILSLLLAAPAEAHFSGFKSPGPGMHFTEGQPIVVFGDLFDSRNAKGTIACPPPQTVSNYSPAPDYGVPRTATCSGGGTPTGWPQFQLLVDGAKQIDKVTNGDTVVNTIAFDHNSNPAPIGFFRFVATGVPAGVHQVVARGLFSVDGVAVDTQDSLPITITVDPAPAKTVVQLSDANASGTITWNNVIVVGNNTMVKPSGKLVIKDSLVTGVAGINGSVTDADIEGSIFEDDGNVTLTVGNGTVVINNNEFRANNRLTFVADDPQVPFIFNFTGNGTNQKLFQGNRVGAGQSFFGGQNWLIGGDTDAQSNIFIGPRAVLNINAKATIVRGNYDHHNYRGAWSQGFNFYYYGAGSDVITEHNFIRDGSWPLQYMAGEIRYNVIFGFGHTWLRTASANTSIHHNLFTPGGDGGLAAGIQCYGGESGLSIYNNTFDGGGAATGDFAWPTVDMTGGSQVVSFRNNLITFSRNQQNNNAGMDRVTGGSAAYSYADYNAFYSPDNTNKTAYDFTGAGAHDVSGTGARGVTDGQLAASPFAGDRIAIDSLNGRMITSVVDEAAVWEGTQKVSYILAAFRARYAPKAGSPIIDAGDPQDNDSQGRKADIGAIDLDGHDQDKLGKFGTAITDLTAPTVTLTAPHGGDMLTGQATVSATAQDNAGGTGVVLVQFQVDGATVAQATQSPYTTTFNSAMLMNGSHMVTAKAWDGAGNFGVSAAVMVSSMNAVVGPTRTGSGGSTGAAGSTGSTGSSGSGGTSGGSLKGSVSGGCGCSLPGSGSTAALPLLLLGAILAASIGRRRRTDRRN